MQVEAGVSLKALNTFGLPAVARQLVRVDSEAAVRQVVDHPEFGRADKFILGGGSNVILTRDVAPLVVKVEVLAIDELGKGRNTEFEGTIVDELVSRRYNAGKPILGTTNYEPEAARGLAAPNLAGGAAPSLPDRVGPRVYSRLEEMCDFVEVPGEDFRTKLREDRRPARGRAAPKIS